MKKKRIAVVGAGIAGVCAARNLAERGHHVTLFDQFPQGHDRGSSHGRSRIIRRAYPDPFYTRCMDEAYPLWHELERNAKTKMIHEVGLVYFGIRRSNTMMSIEDGLREFNVPYENFSPAKIANVFPSLLLRPEESGLFTPEAGWIDAEAALGSTLNLARTAGTEFLTKFVTADDLETFDKVVVTAGSWIRDWWPAAPVTVTLQTFGYVNAQVSGPVWIEDSDALHYGFPSDERGLKIGVHRTGPQTDPRNFDRTPNDKDLAEILDLACLRFGLTNLKLNQAKGCLYTNTDSEDFLLCQLDDRTLVASACSGHGFKFGPWFGRVLADITEERQDVACYGRFLA